MQLSHSKKWQKKTVDAKVAKAHLAYTNWKELPATGWFVP
jgi:hypothetical protein